MTHKHPKRIASHIFLVAALMLALGSAAFWASRDAAGQAMPAGKIVINHGGTMPVTFDHTAHLARAGADCLKCHHTEEAQGMGSSCVECHTVGGKDDVIPSKRAFHLMCNTCHATEKSAPKPRKDCRVCHNFRPDINLKRGGPENVRGPLAKEPPEPGPDWAN